MCGRKVTVDADGRCLLGHQAVPAAVMAERRRQREASRLDSAPQGAGHEDPGARPPRDAGAPEELEALPVMEPVPDIPAGPDARTGLDAGHLPLRIPDRLRQPLAHPTVDDDPTAATAGRGTDVAPPSALDAAMPGSPSSPRGVGPDDLTPAARSVLDVAVPEPAAAAHQAPAAAGPEPLWGDEEPELDEPRGLGTRVAGVAFVVVLVAAAWFLAVSL